MSPTTGLDPQAAHLLLGSAVPAQAAGLDSRPDDHYMDEAEQLCDRLVVMTRPASSPKGVPRELIEQYLRAR